MKQSKKMLAIALLVLLIIFRPQPVSAMHIMEGYLPLVWCIVCPVPLSLSYLR